MPLDLAMENANGVVAEVVPEEEAADPPQEHAVRESDLDKLFIMIQRLKEQEEIYESDEDTLK